MKHIKLFESYHSTEGAEPSPILQLFKITYDGKKSSVLDRYDILKIRRMIEQMDPEERAKIELFIIDFDLLLHGIPSTKDKKYMEMKNHPSFHIWKNAMQKMDPYAELELEEEFENGE